VLSRGRAFTPEAGQGSILLVIAAAAGFGLLVAFGHGMHGAIATISGVF
jgi:hypothetical protein